MHADRFQRLPSQSSSRLNDVCLSGFGWVEEREGERGRKIHVFSVLGGKKMKYTIFQNKRRLIFGVWCDSDLLVGFDICVRVLLLWEVSNAIGRK